MSSQLNLQNNWNAWKTSHLTLCLQEEKGVQLSKVMQNPSSGDTSPPWHHKGLITITAKLSGANQQVAGELLKPSPALHWTSFNCSGRQRKNSSVLQTDSWLLNTWRMPLKLWEKNTDTALQTNTHNDVCTLQIAENTQTYVCVHTHTHSDCQTIVKLMWATPAVRSWKWYWM